MRQMKFLIVAALILMGCLPSKAQNQAGYEWGNVQIGGGGFVTGVLFSPAQKDLIYARTDVGGAYRWNSETQGWIPLLDWNNSSQTSFQGVEAMAIDPQAPNRLYLSVGTEYWNSGKSAILCSEDYGQTFRIVDVTNKFKVHGNGMGRQNGERLAVDPNKGNILFCGSRLNGLFKSDDFGATWAKVTSFPATPTGAIWETNGIAVLVFDSVSGSKGEATPRLFAGISRKDSDNLYVSNDAGATWNPVEGALTTHMPQRMVISNGHLYVAYADASGPWNPSSGRLMKYNLEKNEWTNISPSENPIGGITVDPQNPDILMASTINTWRQQFWRPGDAVWGDRIFRSTDGGKTWTDLFEQRKLALDAAALWDRSMALHWVGDIQIDPFNPDRVFAISGNGLFMSNNITAVDSGAMATWSFQCQGLDETVPLGLVSVPNEALISVIGDYDGFKHTDVSQTPKRHSPSMGTSTGIDFAQRKPKFVVRSGGDENSQGIFYSEDAGTTWTAFKTKPTPKSCKGTVAVSALGDVVFWKPDGVSNTYYTRDLGATWNLVSTASVATRLYADRVNNNYAYTVSGTQLRVLKWNPDTQTYDIRNVPINATPKEQIRPVPTHEGDIWLACGSQGIKHYMRGNDSIETISTVRSCESIGLGKAPEGQLYPAIFIWGNVGGVEGAFRSDDRGKSWIRINDAAHQFGALGNGQFIVGDANVFGRVYLSTVGRGIVMGSIPGEEYTEVPEYFVEIEVVNSASKPLQPQSFGMTDQQFSGALDLSFDRRVQFAVYNLSGACMETGIVEKNASIGQQLNTGMYILKLSDSRNVQSVRILKTDKL